MCLQYGVNYIDDNTLNDLLHMIRYGDDELMNVAKEYLRCTKAKKERFLANNTTNSDLIKSIANGIRFIAKNKAGVFIDDDNDVLSIFEIINMSTDAAVTKYGFWIERRLGVENISDRYKDAIIKIIQDKVDNLSCDIATQILVARCVVCSSMINNKEKYTEQNRKNDSIFLNHLFSIVANSIKDTKEANDMIDKMISDLMSTHYALFFNNEGKIIRCEKTLKRTKDAFNNILDAIYGFPNATSILKSFLNKIDGNLYTIKKEVNSNNVTLYYDANNVPSSFKPMGYTMHECIKEKIKELNYNIAFSVLGSVQATGLMKDDPSQVPEFM